MMRIIMFTSIFLLSSLILFSQPKFELVEVDRVETSYNSVTCTVHENSSGFYIYSAGDGNKIDVLEIEPDGKMKTLANYVVAGGKNTVRGLITDQIEGKDFLFAGLKGESSIEVFEIQADGRLNSVHVVPDTDSTFVGIAITLQVVHMKTASYLFVGGLENTPGLSSFKISSNGNLKAIQSVEDTKEIFTDGIIGMSIHRIDGKTFLFTGGFHDNGISSWQVYEDGTFDNVSNIGDNANLYLNGTYPVISASINGWNYVIVGHRHHIYYKPTPWVKDRYSYYHHGDAISVFWVNPEGELVPRSAFQDDTETLLKGQTRLHKLPFDKSYDIIAAATRDDQSIQLCVINQTGRLIDAGKIKTGFPIYYGLCGQKIGEHLFLFAGSVEGKTFASYRLDKL